MGQKATAYVIAGDDAVRDSIGMLLECHGLSVRSYASAAAYLSDERPVEKSCLVVDADMPGRAGPDVMGQLRRAGITLPAMAMTSGVDPKVRAAISRSGATLLLKPFAPDALVDVVKEIFRRYEA